ncbi:MAG: winged helix-turn-helix domain-containing protein [Methanothrix sp.]
MRREFVYGALGWLGRENKIGLKMRGRAIIVSLMP